MIPSFENSMSWPFKSKLTNCWGFMRARPSPWQNKWREERQTMRCMAIAKIVSTHVLRSYSLQHLAFETRPAHNRRTETPREEPDLFELLPRSSPMPHPTYKGLARETPRGGTQGRPDRSETVVSPRPHRRHLDCISFAGEPSHHLRPQEKRL